MVVRDCQSLHRENGLSHPAGLCASSSCR
jgi:hypothetical protein